MSARILNMLGRPCPIPVVEARKAIRDLQEGESITVLVDNRIACENLKKMADGNHYGYWVDELENSQFSVVLTLGKIEKGVAPFAEKDLFFHDNTAYAQSTVVVIGQDYMGSGEQELGRILIKGFIYALSELEEVPKKVLLFNSGIKLACKDHSTLGDLQKLQQRGCQILICGTCVDYFGCKDNIAVGNIVNMYGIVTAMVEGSSRVINI